MVYGSVQSRSLLRQPMTNAATLPESLEIPDATKLPLLGADADMPLHVGLLIALLLARWSSPWSSTRTVFGLRLRAVGLNPVAARRAGMPHRAAHRAGAGPRRRAAAGWPARSCCRATRAA